MKALSLYQSKAMAHVKVFVDKQINKMMDKQTGQKLYAPDLSMRGHKKKYLKTFENLPKNIPTERFVNRPRSLCF